MTDMEVDMEVEKGKGVKIAKGVEIVKEVKRSDSLMFRLWLCFSWMK